MAQNVAGSPLFPAAPDFLTCDPTYGVGIDIVDCYMALNHGGLDTSATPTTYVEGVIGYSHYLPFFTVYGSCRVTIELAGHSSLPRFLTVAPSAIRALATQVTIQCPSASNGIGGFGTLGLQRVVNYIGTGPGFLARLRQGWPADSAFLTVTVSSASSGMTHAGDTDPDIPIALAETLGADISLADALRTTAAGMQRGGNTVWWNITIDTPPSDGSSREVDYQCDSALGSPSVIDCAQIEWNQLGPGKSAASDTVKVSPEAPIILHQNTCYLAISAATSVVLTWSQVRTAVEALMNICIQAPLRGPQGGRAYYTTSSQPSTKRKMRRRRDSSLTGLNALPPPVTVTIFEQKESWISMAAELVSCTWKAVLKKVPVSLCPS